MVRDGTLFSYDRNFGSIGNAGFAKVQRRIFDYHACQGRATLEGSPADSRDVVGKRYACQGRATDEGILADARDALGNRDACQGFAQTEGAIADARDAVWNRNFRQSAWDSKKCFSVFCQQKVGGRFEGRIAGINGKRCKTGATAECLIVDVRYAFWNGYTRQGFATPEGFLADARDTVWNRYILQSARNGNKCFSVFCQQKAGDRFEGRIAGINGKRCKTGATCKAPPVESRDAVWNCYACQGFATLEGVFVDTRDAFRNRYACQGRAIFKGSPADSSDGFSTEFRRNGQRPRWFWEDPLNCRPVAADYIVNAH